MANPLSVQAVIPALLVALATLVKTVCTRPGHLKIILTMISSHSFVYALLCVRTPFSVAYTNLLTMACPRSTPTCSTAPSMAENTRLPPDHPVLCQPVYYCTYASLPVMPMNGSEVLACNLLACRIKYLSSAESLLTVRAAISYFVSRHP